MYSVLLGPAALFAAGRHSHVVRRKALNRLKRNYEGFSFILPSFSARRTHVSVCFCPVCGLREFHHFQIGVGQRGSFPYVLSSFCMAFYAAREEFSCYLRGFAAWPLGFRGSLQGVIFSVGLGLTMFICSQSVREASEQYKRVVERANGSRGLKEEMVVVSVP